jgi:hypothetical protein
MVGGSHLVCSPRGDLFLMCLREIEARAECFPVIAHFLSIQLRAHQIIDNSVLMSLWRCKYSTGLLHYHLRVHEAIADFTRFEESGHLKNRLFNYDLIFIEFVVIISLPEYFIDILRSHSLCCLCRNYLPFLPVLLEHGVK